MTALTLARATRETEPWDVEWTPDNDDNGWDSPPNDYDGDRPKIEVHLVQGLTSEGRTSYAYLAIYAHNVADLNISLATRYTDLEEFGVILLAGYGEPDEKIKSYIRENYLKQN